ncbi:MAG: peptidoglycan-binding domain-containing protein [Ideonella sp.]
MATQPKNTGLPTIRKGSQGLHSAYCQNLLNARMFGMTSLWVDGMFGANTDARVRRFQGSNGLVADGVVGPLTWAALEAGPPAINRRPNLTPEVQVPVTGGI